MLAGLAVEPAPVFATRAVAGEPRVVFEDAWLVVVEKPAGMLSVPGRGNALQDSAITRLRARFPERELSLVHRLDLDTSGLLLVAKDPATHAALQARFAQRLVDKRYLAILDGEVAGDHGTIELPLRVDVDDRPRQIVDHVHGKRAVTEWHVIAREPGRTRIAFHPRTGRTHQLRVHAAVGLGAPIAGDRLYGKAGERLLLHAESLAFDHPHTRERVELVSLVPF
jgi:tRNA pseudouridine32 synthase/23S rRNA pseudouridine746 synthase